MLEMGFVYMKILLVTDAKSSEADPNRRHKLPSQKILGLTLTDIISWNFKISSYCYC